MHQATTVIGQCFVIIPVAFWFILGCLLLNFFLCCINITVGLYNYAVNCKTSIAPAIKCCPICKPKTCRETDEGIYIELD